MAFTTINGIRIHYLVQGSGPFLLMFAPGGFRSVISRWTAAGGKREWQEMDGLAALSRHFTCIAYDRRESGLSGGRVEPLTWDLYVQEAKALLEVLWPVGRVPLDDEGPHVLQAPPRLRFIRSLLLFSPPTM